MACGAPGAGTCAPAEPTMAMVTAAVTPIKRCLISSTLWDWEQANAWPARVYANDTGVVRIRPSLGTHTRCA